LAWEGNNKPLEVHQGSVPTARLKGDPNWGSNKFLPPDFDDDLALIVLIVPFLSIKKSYNAKLGHKHWKLWTIDFFEKIYATNRIGSCIQQTDFAT
jgi:hypothetical protein